MNSHLPFILLLVGAFIFTSYGWWCFFRTESAMEFARVRIFGDTLNRVITKIHGVFFLLFGPAMLIASLAHFLGYKWAQ